VTDAFPGLESALADTPGEPSEPRVRESRGDVTLVTGAAGFIGRHVVSQLGSAGGEVIAIEHAWHCRAALESLLGTSAVDRCIHLGWYADPADYLSSETANLVSLRSSIELVGVLMSRGCQHLTVAGTSAEYRPSASALSERDDVEEATPYAQAKATLRDLTAELSRLNVLPTAWCRIFNVAGPGEHPGRLLPLVARALLEGSPLDLTDGTQVRDYLDVRDVAAALAAVSGARLSGPVNLCSGEGVRLKDLISDLASRCGPVELLHFGARRRRPGDPDAVVGDNTRLRNEARWQVSRPRSRMLDDVVEYWRSRLEER
jgi:dTDP-6-deoxy-L-talose 4-dehydrogenase (NAD+)